MKLLLKFTLIAVFTLFAINANAQISTPIDGVDIQLDSTYPRPGQSVEVSIESYSFDLNSSSIVWTIGGKVVEQGVGIVKINVTSPSIGKKLDVRAGIKGPDGREVQKSITIQTSSVDIIWESGGYTPPFFPGKLPFYYQNPVKITAIPHMSTNGVSEIDPKTLVYTWKLGGKYIEGGQGYGKQSVIIPADDLPKDLDVTVDVTTKDQSLHSASGIKISPIEQEVLFYEEDSLYGVLFNKSLTGRNYLKNAEMKVLAVPYGFNILNRNISYNWSINNIEQPDLIKNRSITLRTKGDSDGSSSIGLDLRNQDDILQGARGGFEVYFSKKK